jgi:histidinol-phosphate aminotransferase
VNVHRVPLTATGAHDVKAMLAVSNNIGAFYICNPNNPTGTMTPKADIVWLVNNKPEGSVVIIDEAYHHFSPDESSIDLVAADKDVIVLRTFSKVYGMAGLQDQRRHSRERSRVDGQEWLRLHEGFAGELLPG